MKVFPIVPSLQEHMLKSLVAHFMSFPVEKLTADQLCSQQQMFFFCLTLVVSHNFVLCLMDQCSKFQNELLEQPPEIFE